MHFDQDETSTRFLEQNVLNLAYAQYEGVGKYDMPMMLPTHVDNLKYIPLQGFNYALSEKHPEKIGVHFFLHDYQFERVWNNPDRYIDILKRFAFVLSPDFSPYADMPFPTKLFNVYRNRWCGRFWQDNGIAVIPTFTMGDPDSFEYCSDGIPKHSTIAISTMGEGRWGGYKGLFSMWDAMMEKLEPDTILLYGKDLSSQLKGNIIVKKMISTKAIKEGNDGSKNASGW